MRCGVASQSHPELEPDVAQMSCSEHVRTLPRCRRFEDAVELGVCGVPLRLRLYALRVTVTLGLLL